MTDAGTTARIRRRPAGKFAAFRAGQLPLQRDDSPPAALPLPCGDLRAAPAEQILRVSIDTWGTWRNRDGNRQRGIETLLGYLAGFDGQSWQARWTTAGLSQPGRPVTALGRPKEGAGTLTTALGALFALRVIVPCVGAVRTNRILDFAETFRRAQADPDLDALFTKAEHLIPETAIRHEALTDVTLALTTQNVALADLMPGRLLAYVLDRRSHVIATTPHCRKRYAGHDAWDLLHRAGHFPPGTPAALKEAVREPKLSPAELVSRHALASAEMTRLITEYLTIRASEMDYSSLRVLASYLAGLFWKQIEILAPAQQDLRLPPTLYEQWRETVRWREDGSPRREQDTILHAIRSFYYDLATWALQEPEKWAVWVAPCPIPQRELRGAARRRRRVSERVAGRTRQRQPLLPRLVEQVENELAVYTELLRLGEGAAGGDQFEVADETWTRVFSRADARRRREHGSANVRLRNTSTGLLVHVSREEERAFWDWAIVETLRHSGIRIEELLELSQLSVRQYRRPNGEVIALLVIAPSKTDRERVIPMSAELFAVIAAIIRRLTRYGPITVYRATTRTNGRRFRPCPTCSSVTPERGRPSSPPAR